MAEMLEEQRENWGTRGGFVLAAVGSAVGLGNLWGFPYKLYSYGGGAFLIPYITAMFCIGIPMLIMEFSLGHYTQRAAPDAFRRVNKRMEFVGWWSILMGFVIITYYPIILAYCFSFIWHSLVGIFNGGELPWAGEGLAGVTNAKEYFFTQYLGFHESIELGAFRWNIFWPLLLAWVAMYFCIFKGVKLVGKIVWLTVPLPWLMLFILAVRGMTLDGSMKGLVYFLDPVWSELAKPSTWRFAFGQVFFSLSLAFGVMVTYASFLHRKSDINNNAAIIGLADFATSFVAGIAIFATIGGMAFVTAQAGNPVPIDKVVSGGPGLAFVAFPYALAQLPGSAWWSFVFFFTLVTLGIDSAFSITESVLAGIVDKTGWKRSIVLPVMSLIGIVFGLAFCTKGGLNWVGTIDGFINGTWGIAFLGLLECFVLGWIYRIENLREHANERSDWKLGIWWNYLIRLAVPLVLGVLFMWSLLDDFTSESGFLRSPDGKWIWTNCVGMIVVSLAPILAVIMSMIKSPVHEDVFTGETEPLSGRQTACRKEGKRAFILSLVSVGLLLTFIFKPADIVVRLILMTACITGCLGLLIANYAIDKGFSSLQKPSRLARAAGIVSTLSISFVVAIVLNVVKKKFQLKGTEDHVYGVTLSSTAYIILGIVFLLIFGGLGWCFYRAIVAGENQKSEKTDE